MPRAGGRDAARHPPRRGATTIRSADLPSSCSFRIGLYQKKSRERRRTILGSVTTGISPRSATSACERCGRHIVHGPARPGAGRSRRVEFGGDRLRSDDKAETLPHVVDRRGQTIVRRGRGGAILQQQAVIAAEIGVLQRAQHALVGIDAGEQQRRDAEVAQDAVEFGVLKTGHAVFRDMDVGGIGRKLIDDRRGPAAALQHLCAGPRQRVAETDAGAAGLVDMQQRRAEIQPVGPVAPVHPDHRNIMAAQRGQQALQRRDRRPRRRDIDAEMPSQPSGWQKSFCMSMTMIAVRARSSVTSLPSAWTVIGRGGSRLSHQIGPGFRNRPAVAHARSERP